MKISQWLIQSVDAGSINLSSELKTDFTKQTGLQPPSWNERSAADFRQELKEGGCGGSLSPELPPDAKLVGGVEVSATLAKDHGWRGSCFFGRGRQHQQAIEFLESKGL